MMLHLSNRIDTSNWLYCFGIKTMFVFSILFLSLPAFSIPVLAGGAVMSPPPIPGIITDILDATRAADSEPARELVKDILTIVYNIVTVVGVIFVIIGLVKYVIAHANEQGPEQQKAAMMMATGLVLILLPAILSALDLQNYVTVIYKEDIESRLMPYSQFLNSQFSRGILC